VQRGRVLSEAGNGNGGEPEIRAIIEVPDNVLLVVDVFHSLDHFAIEHFGDRDVRHRGCRRCPVPVPFTGLEPHDVAGRMSSSGLPSRGGGRM
jgi:hypothetical protein